MHNIVDVFLFRLQHELYYMSMNGVHEFMKFMNSIEFQVEHLQ